MLRSSLLRTSLSSTTRPHTLSATHHAPSPILSLPHHSTRPFSISTLKADVIGETKVDQTKQDNHPDGERRESGDIMTGGVPNQHDDHPAKKGDPQPKPSRSTGFEKHGTEGKAGDAKEGDVKREEYKAPGMNQ